MTRLAKEIPLTHQVLRLEKTNSSSPKDLLVIHTESHIEVLRPEDILYVHAHSNYSVFHFEDGSQFLVSKTLGSFVPFLSKHHFIRVHRSYLVNIYAIRRITRAGGMEIELDRGQKIPVSRRQRKDLLKKFQPTC